MAWGRKKSGGRREPMFGLAASLSELRLGPQDRGTGADDKPKPKASRAQASRLKASRPNASKRQARDPDPPRERTPRGKSGSKRRSRGALYSLFYWGAVV